MSIFEALALGIVQGLTEFFPVSSSGHLVLAEALLGVNPSGVSFEVLVHLATLAAVLTVYRGRVVALAAGTLRGDVATLRYLGMLGVATIPAGVVGLSLSGAIAGLFDRPLLAAVSLLVTGAVVYSTRWLARLGDRANPGWAGSLAVGIVQAAALVPGLSRSGLTVAAALAARTERTSAAEFSFLLSVPAILGAAVLQMPELLRGGASGGGGAPELVTAFLSAFVAGVLAITLFVRWLQAGTFHRFAYYCWVVAALYIVYAVSLG